MAKKVLVVDDDRVLLLMIKNKCEKYSDRFSLVFAKNGLEAMEILSRDTISLVVTDLQMPEMDGFELLAQLSNNYPDIPVIIQTAYGSSQYRRDVLEGGAVGYLEKPIDTEELAREIITILQEEEEHETLQSVPLELFVKLIAMEQKTCTIRIEKRSSAEQGILFFKRGELLDARINKLQGKSAALEIFSLDEMPFSIQDGCPVEDKKIDGGLSSILPDL